MRHSQRRLRSVVRMLVLVAALLAARAGAAEEEPKIVVWKAKRELWVQRGERVLRRYPISLGRSPEGAKQFRGDNRTPVGAYYVYEKRPKSKYHRFLGISYPGIDDAERALRAGHIDAYTWADVWFATKRREKPPWNTPLGGFVGIHGTGAEGRQARLRHVSDWTEGCIALSDRHVEELYAMIPVGAVVEIHE